MVGSATKYLTPVPMMEMMRPRTTDHEEDEMIKEGMKWRQPGSIPATVWALLGFVVGLVGIFELAGF